MQKITSYIQYTPTVYTVINLLWHSTTHLIHYTHMHPIYIISVAKPRKHTSRSNTLSQGSSPATKDLHKTKTLPHSSSSSKQFGQSQPSGGSQGEDDAYTTLHPSGTSASTLNTGDSGFEDVRPLQRLDQEPVDEDDVPGPAGKQNVCTYNACFCPGWSNW